MLVTQPESIQRQASGPRIGLAIAGGGPVGLVYEIGALHALSEALEGIDFNHLTVYVGVSAGAVTAALFLRRFVEKAQSWAHLDVFGWCPVEKPHCPVGGEAQGIRAIERVLAARYGGS